MKPTWVVITICLLTGGGCLSSRDDDTDSDETVTVAPIQQENIGRDPQQRTVAAEGTPEEPVAGETTQGSELDEARTALAAGEIDTARSKVRAYLLAEPNDVFGLFLAGQIEAARGQYRDAVELVDQIPRDHPQAGLAALGQSADWMLAADEWDEAERRYKALLAVAPTANMAHRRLAYLLNRQGRREEASSHVRQLCRLGDVSQAELHTLINQCESIYDEARDADSKASNFAPIGPAAEARILFSRNEFKSALSILREPMKAGTLPPPGQALFGRLATEVDDPAAIDLWLRNLNEDQRSFSDYWVAVGTLLLRDRSDIPGAARLFCEAIVRNPTDWIAITRLENCMDLLGDAQQKNACRARAMLLRESMRISNRIVGKEKPDANDIAQLAQLLEKLGRPVEAVMWRAIGFGFHGGLPQTLKILDETRQQLVARLPADMQPQEALAGLELTRYPLPQSWLNGLGPIQRTMPRTHGLSITAERIPVFPDVAESVGIDFQYFNASQPKLADLQLYEQMGGGIAAIDYDCDGRVDLYFNQGGNDPKLATRGKSNALYRNLGNRFAKAKNAQVHDDGYGQGVTSGDWNQDGLPDLVLANFGVNTLMINNGDGTFRPATVGQSWRSPFWTVSVAIADISGDNLPDIIEVNYVDDPAVHEVAPRGADGRFTTFKGPESYRPAKDRLFVSRGNGSMNAKTFSDDDSESKHGLGLVVTDIDGEPGNEVFVANDTDANQLWFLSDESSPAQFVFDNLAGIRGCAYSGRGGSGASMGIATADFDRNGMIDLHVTNFLNEPVHLYQQSHSNNFSDAVVKSDLYGPSMQVLGFGTQAIDYDNNGAVDLAVVNGHIDDMQFKGLPHKMLPQLFAGRVGSFVMMEVADDTGYWNRPAIGRGLLRLDWNRDGRMDLLATHHDAPAALLENRTETELHWLQFRLVGTTSERDAIGARVTVHAGGEEFVDVVTAGDGYACKNEAIVAFGLGSIDRIDQLTVQWPGGGQQAFSIPHLDDRFLLIENSKTAFADQLNQQTE